MSMHEELGKLIELLSSPQIRQSVQQSFETRFSSAVERFPDTVSNPRELERAIGLFRVRLSSPQLEKGMNADFHDMLAEVEFRRVWPHLANDYENQHALYRIFSTGVEGGRRAFLLRLLSACIASEIKLKVDFTLRVFLEHWESCSVEERKSLTELYFSRCAHLYPADVLEQSIMSRLLSLPGYLRKHAAAVEQLRVSTGVIR